MPFESGPQLMHLGEGKTSFSAFEKGKFTKFRWMYVNICSCLDLEY
jgi:hypothetical protein